MCCFVEETANNWHIINVFNQLYDCHGNDYREVLSLFLVHIEISGNQVLPRTLVICLVILL
jgi:hypothetical protein